MKKIFFIAISFLFFSCGSEVVQNDCFRGISVNETVNLNNPEFVNLRVDAANVITTLPQSGRKIIIIKRSSSNIKAFDLQCPLGSCTSSMTFDGLKLKCPCSEKEYNSLNGTPIDGKGCFALEYTVTQTSSSLLRISR